MKGQFSLEGCPLDNLIGNPIWACCFAPCQVVKLLKETSFIPNEFIKDFCSLWVPLIV